jgi:hypothetical protein
VRRLERTPSHVHGALPSGNDLQLFRVSEVFQEYPAGAEQAAKKGLDLTLTIKKLPSGAKARLILGRLWQSGLKP